MADGPISSGIEREVKLGAWPGFAPPDLEEIAEGVHAVAGDPLTLTATYYDTADLRLMRWGVTLRHRTGDKLPWTVKLAKPEKGAALVRREVGFAGGPDSMPGGIADLVRAYSRSDPLVVVARLRSHRASIDLVDGDGRRLAQAVDDEVEVLGEPKSGRGSVGEQGDQAEGGDARSGGTNGDEPEGGDTRSGGNEGAGGSVLEVLARFREVEVEIEADAPAGLLDAVVARLRQAGAGAPDPTPKVVRAVGPRALDPPELVPVELGSSPTVGDVFRAAMVRAVTALLHHDPGVRLGEDVESVHQARVATRTLRSNLRTFSPVLDRDWLKPLREELSWFGGLLGAVRDTDVLRERLARQGAALPAVDEASLASVLARVDAQREAARALLLEAMSEPRYVGLLDRLVDGAQAPALEPKAAQPALEALPRLARGPWRDLRKAESSAVDDSPDEVLHALRIRAKRARYASEACAPVIPEARTLAKAVAGLQTVLGDHQDAVQAEAWLRENALGADSTAADGVVVGELMAAQRLEAAACRAEWPAAWKRANQKDLRTWL